MVSFDAFSLVCGFGVRWVCLIWWFGFSCGGLLLGLLGLGSGGC